MSAAPGASHGGLTTVRISAAEYKYFEEPRFAVVTSEQTFDGRIV